MATVELRPGDTLNVIWSSIQKTPLGTKEVESNFAFTYEELLERLQAKGKAGKSRRSGTEGARFSRVIALAHNALRKGTWSTGAQIDRAEVFMRLMAKFGELADNEYQHITANARAALGDLYRLKSGLKPKQREELKQILDRLGLPAKD